MKKINGLLLSTLTAAMLIGCGGGSSGGSGTPASETPASGTSTPTTTTQSFVAGNQLIFTSATDGSMTANFNTDGTYSEVGSTYSCSGLWKDLGSNKIAVTCEDKGTTIVPTESDTTFQFTSSTLTNGSTVEIKGDVNTTPENITLTANSVLSTTTPTETPTTPTTQTPTTPTTTTSFISGKTISASDGEGSAVLSFSTNGNYSETYSDGNCSGLWKDLGSNKIAVTCLESGTSTTPSDTVSSTTNILEFSSSTPVIGDKIIYTEPDGSFTITITPSTTTPTETTTPTTTTSFISGKTISASDSEDSAVLSFSANGTYSETYPDGNCSGLWKDLGSNKIAVTCIEGGTTVAPSNTVDVYTDILKFSSSSPVIGDNIIYNDFTITINAIN